MALWAGTAQNMSAKSCRKAAQFGAMVASPAGTMCSVMKRLCQLPCARALPHALVAAAAVVAGVAALAQPAPPPSSASMPLPMPLPRDGQDPAQDQALARHIESMVREAAAQAWPAGQATPRVEVSVGRLDARLKLAPCRQVQPYLPPGSRAVGSLRIGLRCVQGEKAWNVYLPVVVKLYGRSLVAARHLNAGTRLGKDDLVEAEVDLAARNDAAISQPSLALGRTLAQGLNAGQPLYRGDLRVRQWFKAGDLVRVVAMGPGWQISSEARALDAGHEGQPVRARTDNGHVVTGLATAERRLELPL